MEGDVGVVSEYVKHGEEVNIEEEWAEDRSLGDAMVMEREGEECLLILTEEERLVM